MKIDHAVWQSVEGLWGLNASGKTKKTCLLFPSYAADQEENVNPSSPPHTKKKNEKTRKRPSNTELEKETGNTLENKPVLAWEREARLKE